ncbi:MAG: hypothetical protein ABR526_08225 [Chthoniobacterales bacterium]
MRVQVLAAKTYRLWRQEPSLSSLQFKKLRGGAGDRVSIRIGARHRAVGRIRGDTVQWVWIGTHEQYNKLV